MKQLAWSGPEGHGEDFDGSGHVVILEWSADRNDSRVSDAAAPPSSARRAGRAAPARAGGALARDHPVGVVDRVDASEVGDDVVELVDVADLEHEPVAYDAVGQRLHAPADDVHARVRKRACDVLEQVVAVERLDLDLDPEGLPPRPSQVTVVKRSRFLA